MNLFLLLINYNSDNFMSFEENSLFIKPKHPFLGKIEQDLSILVSTGRNTLKKKNDFLLMAYSKS